MIPLFSEKRSMSFYSWLMSFAVIRLILFGSGALIIIVVGGFFLFVYHINLMTVPTEISKADAIVVLTGGRSRLDVAVKLLKQGNGRKLLISGVHPRTRIDRVGVAMGADKDLFICCVDTDHVALNTAGNAEQSALWARKAGYGSIILVTSDYHMPRSLLEMKRFMEGIEIRPYPVRNNFFVYGFWVRSTDAFFLLLVEYGKYLGSLIRSLTASVFLVLSIFFSLFWKLYQ